MRNLLSAIPIWFSTVLTEYLPTSFRQAVQCLLNDLLQLITEGQE